MNQQRAARFGFLKLVVRELKHEVQFYQAVLGCGEGQFIVGEIAGRPIEEILLTGPGGETEMLIMIYTDGRDPAAQPTGVITGIFTPNIEAFEQRVLAAGGRVVQPIGPIQLPTGASRLAFYADPEDYLLEVIEG